MSGLKKVGLGVGGAVLALAAFIFLNNANLFGKRPPGVPLILAHRGFSQTFDEEGVKNDTCTAKIIHQPTHDYLENTLRSMRAAFDAGADVVEFDVHPTTDGQFAVFHDWTVDCRTEGHGVTREHSLAELKALDIGYGYTADGGKTFPFRGKGVGMMPSLQDVLQTFPDRRFIINIKSNDAAEGAMLADALNKLPAEQRSRLIMYADGAPPLRTFQARAQGVRTVSKGIAKACLINYLAYGWTGLTPEACRNTMVGVPINYAPWMWGWPDRFLDRMESAGSVVFVLGPYHGEGHSIGLDTPDMLAELPPGYSGGIFTNEIGVVAKAVKPKR